MMRLKWGYRPLLAICGLLAVSVVALAPLQSGAKGRDRGRGNNSDRYFRRIATFPIFLNTDVDTETVAEIVAAADDGNLLVYTDSATENVGFVDITDPSNPQPDGIVAVGGEPTSVAVKGNYALVGVNTSPSFVAPSGKLVIIDVTTRTIVHEIDLEGQPDCVAISPNQRYAAIAIENERDEDLGNGEPPQLPAGFVMIIDLVGAPTSWVKRKVELTGIADLFPEDPEPEFIDINNRNIAVVTLQENNHIVLIQLADGAVIGDWSAGTVDLDQVDTNENDLIEQIDSLNAVPREPDAVKWISNDELATADEGDLFGGSRGFTIFDDEGNVRFNSGNTLEHLMASIGHYPEGRSENKGNEPEGVTYARYGGDKLLFVGSERSSVISVYNLDKGSKKPVFHQVLPASGVGPEGLLTIPRRGLFVVASENDSREDKFRSTLTIYKRVQGSPTYPTVVSKLKQNDVPIPWAALSCLAADPKNPNIVYSAHDSFFQQSRIYRMDVHRKPAVITDEIVLHDEQGTVNLDIEGLATREQGGFWVVSEGAGAAGDAPADRTLNLLLKVAKDGEILETITLPDAVNDLQIRFGFEGVAAVNVKDDDHHHHGWRGRRHRRHHHSTTELVYVAFQREWTDDPEDRVRIGQYNTETDEWRFFYYPLDAPTSPNGGWVGLSEIVAVTDEIFAVVERDNQSGTDATIKQICLFSIAGVEPAPQGDPIPELDKVCVRDLIPDLTSDNGTVLEKVEGLTILRDGKVLIVTDNDGVDDASGETQLIRIGGN